MNYEQRYKEALEKIREGLQPLQDGAKISGVTRAFLEEVFPELKESEDERIRKVLIDYFNRYKEQEECGVKTFFGIPTDNIIAWIEKQKSVGEIVERCKNSWYNEGKIAGMADGLTNDEKYQQGWHDALEKQGEKKPIMNVPTREVILAIWDLGNEWKELTDGDISTEYGTQLDYIQKHWHESEYYLREKQGEKKSAWNEDDERIITALMEGFRYHQLFNPRFGEVPNTEIISWIKSLKE